MLKINLEISTQQTTFKERIAYVLDFLCHHPLVSRPLTYSINQADVGAAIDIAYGKTTSQKPNCFFIPAQQIAFSKQLPIFSKLHPNTYRYAAHELYSTEYEQKPQQPFFQERHFGFDWIETIFFHISRYEEFHCPKDQMDTWDMMKKEAQFLSKYHLQEKPVVDHLVFCCLDVLGLAPLIRPTTYCLTHDIDAVWKFPSLWKYARAAARQWLKDQRLSSQKELLLAYWQSLRGQAKDPYDTFDWLLQEGRGEKIIYWLTGGITRYDHFFDIHHPYVKELIILAKSRGYHIGLHPSYAAHQRMDLLKEELAALEAVSSEKINFSRQHFLHLDFNKTPQLLESCGIQNDSSLGYQDILGFRCGTGFAYQLYNFEKEKAFSFVELPLVIMDTAVLMDSDEDVEACITKIDHFLKANRELTHITFNFHNSTFDPLRLDAERFKVFYLKLCQQIGF